LLRNQATGAELVPKYQLHPDQIYAWEKQPLDGAAAVFLGGTSKDASREAEVTELYTKSRIFLPEVRAMNRAEGKAMIPRGLADLSVRRQCAARLARCGVCRRPAPPDAEELALMRWLDEQIWRRRS
jgi:transposase